MSDSSVLERIPTHVLAAFAIDPAEVEQAEELGAAWGFGIRADELVFVQGEEHAYYGASIRESIAVKGVRVARPVRTSDGRLRVGGFTVSKFVEGSSAGSVDAVVAAALHLADGLADIEQPTLDASPGGEAELFIRSEIDAWRECDERWGRIDAPTQLGHTDVLGTVIHPRGSAPLITEVMPTVAPRPHGYSAALVAIDGLIYDAVDAQIFNRFAHIPHWGELLLRACAYRRTLSERHPTANSLTCARISAVEKLVVSWV